MRDPGLNEILAQYFPGRRSVTAFAGSVVHRGSRAGHESTSVRGVVRLAIWTRAGRSQASISRARSSACCSRTAIVLVETGDVTSRARPRRLSRLGARPPRRATRETVYYAVAVYSEGANGIVAFDAAVEERLRDAVPRAAGGAHRSRRRGRDPRGEHTRRRAAPRLVLAAGRRDRRHPDRGDARRHRARDAEVPLAAGGTAPGSADVVEPRRRTRRRRPTS